MAEGMSPMASEHKRIVDRLEALERRYEEDNELRRIHREHHKVLHKWLEERQKALVESVSHLDKVAARNAVVEERLGWHVDRMNRLEARLQTAEGILRGLASKPDDFGCVTSTGAPKRERRFMVVKDRDLAFSREDGYVLRCAAANPACVPPMLFERLEDAGEIIRLLDLQDAEIEPVEAIERDGRLIEVRYA